MKVDKSVWRKGWLTFTCLLWPSFQAQTNSTSAILHRRIYTTNAPMLVWYLPEPSAHLSILSKLDVKAPADITTVKLISTCPVVSSVTPRKRNHFLMRRVVHSLSQLTPTARVCSIRQPWREHSARNRHDSDHDPFVRMTRLYARVDALTQRGIVEWKGRCSRRHINISIHNCLSLLFSQILRSSGQFISTPSNSTSTTLIV